MFFLFEAAGLTQQNELMTFIEKYLQTLTMCYNMGWQHHSSGSAYSSMSGHAFLVGANSKQIIKCILF